MCDKMSYSSKDKMERLVHSNEGYSHIEYTQTGKSVVLSSSVSGRNRTLYRQRRVSGAVEEIHIVFAGEVKGLKQIEDYVCSLFGKEVSIYYENAD